jgi:hypothetical protein
MSRRKCDACGRMANKHKRRMILSPDGTMTPGLVCNPCAFGRCIQIVPISREAPCSLCTAGSKADATVCLSCARDLAEKAVRGAWVPYVTRLRKLAKAYKHDDNALHEGLTMAADILSRGGLSIPEESAAE